LQEIETKHATLQRTVNDLRADLENKSTILHTTQERLSKRETEVGHLESEVLRLKAQTGDAETLAIIKRELSDQVTHIRKLEGTNRDQSAELRHYRRVHKAVEIVEEEKRALQSKLDHMEDLQHELREAQLQRQILEDERRSWASYLQNEDGSTDGVEFDSPEALVRALMEQRVENASLVERLGGIQPQISEKDELIKSLEEERDAFKAEMEKLRAKAGADNRCSRLERQRVLAVKEVEFLREQLKTFDVEDKVDEQNFKRIEELESLIDQYRAEVKQLNDKLSTMEENPQTRDLQPAKRPREDESDERLGQLSRKNRKLQDTLSNLQQSYSVLQSEHAAAMVQLTSLQKSAKTRILALRDNPTAAVEAIKMSSLASLRAENAVLMAQLENPARVPPAEVVPISTLHNARAEYQALQAVVADRDKTILRIKQVYTKVASELRAAVANLLGWEMSPMSNNRIRMTSMLHPGRRTKSSKGDQRAHHGDDDDDDDANSLIFDGALGQFQISGGPDGEFGREIRGLVQFWVNERGSIPLFLAAATMEFYDQSTKAARALNVNPASAPTGR
jgi:mitotic spindle assembly checkpoint protein MAD1